MTAEEIQAKRDEGQIRINIAKENLHNSDSYIDFQIAQKKFYNSVEYKVWQQIIDEYYNEQKTLIRTR
jgi:hypothetical protein